MNTPPKSSPGCAWCIHRDGDLCTHPESPSNTCSTWRDILDMLISPASAVFGGGGSARYFQGGCGPVCRGQVACRVRHERRP
jgi:hypothetical protein